MKLRAALLFLLLVPAVARCHQNPAPSTEPSSASAAQTTPSEAPELTLDEAARLSMAKNLSIRTAIFDISQQADAQRGATALLTNHVYPSSRREHEKGEEAHGANCGDLPFGADADRGGRAGSD